jgi:hypothetical protein
MQSPLSSAGFALQGAGASAVESANQVGSDSRVRLCTFPKHPHSHPFLFRLPCIYRYCGSPSSRVKLLKVFKRGRLTR